MVALVTLEAAKAHLRVEHTEEDADITLKIDEASDLVLNYLKKTIGTVDPEDPSIVDWTPETAPGRIRAAVLMMLSEIYDDRGAGDPSNEVAMGYFNERITAMLHRDRDPALA